MLFIVTIANTNERIACDENNSVLGAMEQLRRKGIPVGCRNGGCGVCKVRVVDGEFLGRKCSRAVISEQEEAQGFSLACKTYPRSEMRVKVVGGMARAVVAPKGASIDFQFSMTWHVVKQQKEI